MIHRPSAILLLGLLGLTVGLQATAQPAPEKSPLKGKKVIEWGWDEPDTKSLRQNVRRMEQFPFDGLVFHATSGKGDNLSWEVWGNRKFTPEELKQAVDDLKATKFHRFTDLFLRVNVTPGKVDWFDDHGWACVVNNFGVAARVVRRAATRASCSAPSSTRG